MKGAALIGLRTVILATPVDTGRARGNWNVGINEVDPTARSEDPSGRNAIARGTQVIGSYVTGTITLSNGLPYIQALDQGHSAQAPAGMTAQAKLAVRNYIERERQKGFE